MTDLFNRLSADLYCEKLPPIENFSITIEAIDKASIYYTRNGEDFEQDIEIEVDYTAGEKASRDHPGSPEEAEITEMFGLSIEERHHWDLYMAERGADVELEIFKVVFDEIAGNIADEADYRYEQMKDRKIEEMM